MDDGGEADLDLGNYERYLDVTLTKDNNITTGKVYKHVIEGEVSLYYGLKQHTFPHSLFAFPSCLIQRKGDYLGKTVQVIPHITDAVQDWLERAARIPVEDTDDEADVCIIEVSLLWNRLSKASLLQDQNTAWRHSR